MPQTRYMSVPIRPPFYRPRIAGVLELIDAIPDLDDLVGAVPHRVPELDQPGGVERRHRLPNAGEDARLRTRAAHERNLRIILSFPRSVVGVGCLTRPRGDHRPSGSRRQPHRLPFRFTQELLPDGSYVVYKIGEGLYKINDPGVTTGKGGAWGVDMYLVCGDTRALLIDLGNNYIDGYAKDVIAPRPNAAEELREVVRRLAGERPLEAALTHAHPDHDGMTGALLDGKVTLWMSDGEDKTALQTQHNLDPAVYTLFAAGTKTFDLGGGRTVETIPVRAHSNGGTVYLLKKDGLLMGDASSARSARSGAASSGNGGAAASPPG